MSYIVGGVAVAGLIYGVASSESAKSKQKKAIANAPKYSINDEAYQNQNIARANAFGRNRAIQKQQENIEQQATNDSAQARDYSSSTTDLLGTIAAINANKNTNLRGLSQDEAMLQNQSLTNLYNINNQLIDEKDKAWNYNHNMPYQSKIAMYRDQIQAGQQLAMKSADSLASVGSQYASSKSSNTGNI